MSRIPQAQWKLLNYFSYFNFPVLTSDASQVPEESCIGITKILFLFFDNN